MLKYNIYNKGDEELFDANGKLTGTVKPLIAEDLDWFKPIERLGYRQEYNMSANAASEKSSFYLSAAYLDEKGYVKSSDFSRFNGRANVSVTPRKWIKVGMNLAGSYQESNFTDTDGNNSYINPFYYSRFMAPIYPVHLHDLSSANGDYLLDGAGNKQYDDGNSRGQNENRHIAWELEDNLAKSYRTTLNGQLYADIKFLKDFTFSIKGDMSLRNSEAQTYNNALIGDGAGSNGRASRTIYRYMNYTFQQQLTWQRAFGEHNVDALLGHENYYYHYNYLYNYKTNQTFPGQTTLNNFSEMTTMTDYYNDVRSESYLARARYNFANKYFAEASFRRDGSSRFHPDHRWGNFGSVGGAWLINHEKFMENVKWVNMLKLKASWGVQGNDRLLITVNGVQRDNWYAYQDQYDVNYANGQYSLILKYKGTKDLTWETSYAFNIGTDFELFNNRLNGTIEYFSRKTVDLLYNKPIPVSSGISTGYEPTNVGDIMNKGVELDLNGIILRGKDYEWAMNFNLTHYTNKITALDPDLEKNGGQKGSYYIYRVGGSLYQSYLKTYAGVDPDTGKALYYVDPDNGDYTKTSNYEEAQQADQGTTLPKVYGGLGTSVRFYGFDFSLQLSYQLGGKYYDGAYQAYMHNGNSGMQGTNWSTDIRKAWTPDNRYTDVPRLSASDASYQQDSSRFLVSSDYLSLNNITLGYTIPKRLTSKLGLSHCRVYLTADNVALLSARKGLDPRLGLGLGSSTAESGANTTSSYSAMRTITGGISLTF